MTFTIGKSTKFGYTAKGASGIVSVSLRVVDRIDYAPDNSPRLITGRVATIGHRRYGIGVIRSFLVSNMTP